MNLLRPLAFLAFALVLGLGLTARAADDHSKAVEHTASGTLAADGHAAKDPALLQELNQGVITSITTLVIFVALVAVLGKFAWGPIAKGLQDREDKIRKDIADAEAARNKAEATLKEYSNKLAAAQEQIRQMLAQAQKDAEGVSAGIKVKAQQDAEEIKERAMKEIDAGKNAAMAEIHDHAATLATSVAEKILRRNINENDQKALVQSSLDQLAAMGRN